MVKYVRAVPFFLSLIVTNDFSGSIYKRAQILCKS